MDHRGRSGSLRQAQGPFDKLRVSGAHGPFDKLMVSLSNNGRQRVSALLAWPWLLVGLVVAACAPSAAPPPAPSPASVAAGSVVRFAWEDAGLPTPFRVSTLGPDGLVLLSLLYDTLIWKDERGVIPWLATNWDVSADGRDYTLVLAHDAKWHDGQPLTADDVAFSFGYYAQHPFRWASTSMVESATALAPDQVRLRLRQPFAPFVENVLGVVPIIPRHVWSRVASPETYDGGDATLGSGPFTLAEYRSADAAYRFVANRDYFRGAVAVAEYQQLNVPAATRIQAVQQGEVDLAWSADASLADLFKDSPRIKVASTAPLSVVRLAVNTARAPLDRKEVRQAVAYALDRARIAETATRDTPIVGSAGLVPPETPWFNPALPSYGFDPDRARSLLAGQTYTLELLADPTYREPELLEPMLKAVGITLVTRRLDAKTRTQLLREGNFQLGEVQHLGVGGDPDFLRRWSVGDEANGFAQGWTFHDPAFERLASEQAAATDPAARRQLVFRMQEILADELPTIPLYYRRFSWAYDSSRYTPFTTWGGLMDGIPFPQNKLSFLRR